MERSEQMKTLKEDSLCSAQDEAESGGLACLLTSSVAAEIRRKARTINVRYAGTFVAADEDWIGTE